MSTSENKAKIIIKSASCSYSLPVEEVGHIMPIAISELVPVPQCSPEILGLTAQGGRVITVIDLSAVLDLKPASKSKIATLITLEKKRDLGLCLGEGYQILTALPADNIESKEDSPQEEATGVTPLNIEELIGQIVTRAENAKGVDNGH